MLDVLVVTVLALSSVVDSELASVVFVIFLWLQVLAAYSLGF